MKPAPLQPMDDVTALPPTPGWITAHRGQGMEDAAFLSGAALGHLHVVASGTAIPHALWRQRLALRAAEVCAGVAGRRERAAELRDAVCLLRPGDHPGPAGEILRQWICATERPMTVASLHRAVPELTSARIADGLEVTGVTAVGRAAAVLEAVLHEMPRAETAALILADAALANAFGWRHVIPLLATVLTQRDLRLRGDQVRLACHKALPGAVAQAAQLAADLARRAARLRAVAPKLRAKGAAQVVDLLLKKDAIAPSALVQIMSDRAARRLCDRLVDLGAVSELTGRSSFRLYGV